MSSSPEKLVIIGSGPAGWSSATYAARAQLQPLVYEGAISEKNRMAGTLPLGQLALTSEVENYAGFPHGDLGGFLESALPKERRMMMPPHEGKGVTGPELMELMRQQAANFGTRIVTDDIAKVDFSSRPFKLFPAEGGVVEATCVIVATGASANWLGLPSEEKFKNRGVSACAVCDGALPRFRNKPIVVVEYMKEVQNRLGYSVLKNPINHTRANLAVSIWAINKFRKRIGISRAQRSKLLQFAKGFINLILARRGIEKCLSVNPGKPLLSSPENRCARCVFRDNASRSRHGSVRQTFRCDENRKEMSVTAEISSLRTQLFNGTTLDSGLHVWSQLFPKSFTCHIHRQIGGFVHDFLKCLICGASHIALHAFTFSGNFFPRFRNHALTQCLTIATRLIENLAGLVRSLTQTHFELGLSPGCFVACLLCGFHPFTDQIFAVVKCLGNLRPCGAPQCGYQHAENYKGPHKGVS
jgi:hypothetical protein